METVRGGRLCARPLEVQFVEDEFLARLRDVGQRSGVVVSDVPHRVNRGAVVEYEDHSGEAPHEPPERIRIQVADFATCVC